MVKTNKNGRGRPKHWTDKELMQLALDTKYKLNGKKLTPSLLERETGVGRNTWSRRMKKYIEELNEPIITSINNSSSSEALLPSVDLIFKKYGNNKTALKNELLDLEILLYDLYKELQEYKVKEEQYEKSLAEKVTLQEELTKQKKRAKHYEQLYNNIMVSSVYPHLQNIQESQIHQLNIKDKLINMEDHLDRNTSLDNLSSHFPDISDESIQKKELDEKSKKRKENMKKLLNEFDRR